MSICIYQSTQCKWSFPASLKAEVFQVISKFTEKTRGTYSTVAPWFPTLGLQCGLQSRLKQYRYKTHGFFSFPSPTRKCRFGNLNKAPELIAQNPYKKNLIMPASARTRNTWATCAISLVSSNRKVSDHTAAVLNCRQLF